MGFDGQAAERQSDAKTRPAGAAAGLAELLEDGFPEFRGVSLPRSATLTRTSLALPSNRSSMEAPSGVNLKALRRRLPRTRPIRSTSMRVLVVPACVRLIGRRPPSPVTDF